MAQFITCPNCGKKIELTEAFTHDIEEKLRKQFESEARRKEREHELALEKKEKEFEGKLAREREKLEKQARKRAEESLAVEIKDLKSQLEEKSKRVEQLENQELNLRRRQRQLEDKERSFKVELQRTLDAERKKIREEAAAKVAEEYRLKDREKDEQLAAMRKQIEELRRKAEQGSGQIKGEVMELELEDVLRSNFRFDDIEPVARGTKGADILQKVRGESGVHCGVMLWESKRAKSWNDGWIQKLKDDVRNAKADIGVLVSTALPKGLNGFGYIEGIWITGFPLVVGLATALRLNLIQLAQAQKALVGRSGKMELIYNYLCGSEFRQRVQAIVESFVAMREDLDAERRAMEKVWAKREKQIERVVQNMAGMYGDLQGIIGAALPSVKLLELPSGDISEP